MSAIELNQEQLERLATADGTAVLIDQSGQPVGYVSPPLTAEELRELERRADSEGPWSTTDEVLAHLNSLESSE